MIVVDTNSIIRFVTRDLPKEASLVKDLLENGSDLFIPDVVFPEVEYVLVRKYSYPRDKQLNIFKTLVSRSNITVSPQIRIAVKFFEMSKLDMADCIIAAYAQKGKLASFDRELLKVSGVKRYFKK